MGVKGWVAWPALVQTEAGGCGADRAVLWEATVLYCIILGMFPAGRGGETHGQRQE